MMRNKSTVIYLFILLIMMIGLSVSLVYFKQALSDVSKEKNVTETNLKSQNHKQAFKRGPHGGRLLQNIDFQTEVTIFESEKDSPKFRIYFFENGQPVNPADVEYQMELKRINKVENIFFKQSGDYLESTVEAAEPHSFQVNITATFKDKRHQWEYESYEGRVELSQDAIRSNAIKIERAQPAVLKMTLNVMGKIMPNEESTVFISPRFPGVVKAVYKKLGDYVRKSETLAVVESNESLQNYEIKSEIDGMVIKRNINIGMYLSGQESVFVISDLSKVWADFNVYRHDLSQVKIGDPIEVKSLDGTINQTSFISYISPVGNESTQSVVARAVLENPKDTWKPGLFISGEITVDHFPVKVAVKDSALQTFRDLDVVFVSSGDVFEVFPVQIGKRNKDWVEIISGLKEGDSYASENSYILKADLEKSGVKHDH